MLGETESTPIERFRILGVPISVVNIRTATEKILSWGESGPAKTVFVREVNGLMLALENERLAELHERASMVVPDGAPLSWVGRMRGLGANIGRTAGADLMENICRESTSGNLGHYFFGGRPGVADAMIGNFKSRFPDLKVVGTFSPPIRNIDAELPLSAEELREIEAIRAVRPDFIWIGISTPKQEYWMMKAQPLLEHGVLLGVGAAFDFHSGTVARAPAWMRQNGLEWLHRFFSEPRRLWRRYLVAAPRFAVMVLIEQITFRTGRRLGGTEP